MYASMIVAGALAMWAGADAAPAAGRGVEVRPGETRPQATAVAGGAAVTLSNCLISLIEEVAVPARDPGVLTDIVVREGQQVATGEKLAQIDDVQSRLEHDAALNRLEVAREQARNDVNVRYSQAAAKVAESEVFQSEEANRKVAGTVPHAELLRLRLTHNKFLLEIEQSKFKMYTDALEAKVRDAEVRASAEEVQRRRIDAPLDGVVVELRKHKGEWVQPGDPILKILRVDRLRIEGFLNAADYSTGELDGRPVTVQVRLPHERVESFQGKVVFVSPQVEAGGEFRVWAEVLNRQENEHWLLRPGLTADMVIQLK